MKKYIFIALLSILPAAMSAQDKAEIKKTGLNLGPLPAIAYDADKGFQIGAILQLFDYGDGTNYPNYNAKTYFEYSFFTKGSQLIQLRHDNKELIPGVRWSSAARITLDKAYDFYGFNGYQSYYDQPRVAAGKAGDDFLFSPFYRYRRNECLIKTDFIGTIVGKLQWQAGLFGNYYKLNTIDYANINKGKAEEKKFKETMPTLYEIYSQAGVISEKEKNGGFVSGFRAGLVYDSRNKEGAPSKGIWADAHLILAPGFMSKMPFYRYSITWRQYLPFVKDDVLTFAYRLNYEGSFGKNDPFYALSYISQMGEKPDMEGMGGYNTVRGIMRTRCIGLDMGIYNAELRWRFVKFRAGKQNIAFGLSAFSDGAMVTRQRDLSALKGKTVRDFFPLADYDAKLLNDTKERPHITFGAGFRFIMNENFIVAAEYGTPLSHFQKNSPVYNQDGTGAFYVNVGYLF